MKAPHRRVFAKVAICALLIAATVPATPQSSTPIGGVTKSDADWIVVAVVAIGAAIGIGIFYSVHHDNSLNGCVVTGSGGLELQNKGDGRTYALAGEVDAIKPGDRVRVAGKKQKMSGGGDQQFVVEKISRDYGACKVQQAAP
jgi:hypothetical protein